jgi:hypothetical protein
MGVLEIGLGSGGRNEKSRTFHRGLGVSAGAHGGHTLANRTGSIPAYLGAKFTDNTPRQGGRYE